MKVNTWGLKVPNGILVFPVFIVLSGLAKERKRMRARPVFNIQRLFNSEGMSGYDAGV